MKAWRDVVSFLLLTASAGCAPRPATVSPEGAIALTRISAASRAGPRSPRRTRAPARGGPRARAPVAATLSKDGECATLHDRLQGFRDDDATTRAPAARARRDYAAKGCEAWLAANGGVGAAWRRVRVSQWTTMRGD